MKRALLALTFCSSFSWAQTPIKLALPCETTAQEISSTGKHVAVACKDHSARVLEVPSGKTIATLGAADDYRVFAFSPNDKLVAMAGGSGVGVLDLSAHAAPKRWRLSGDRVDFVKFVSDHVLVAGSPGGAGEVWDFSGTPMKKASLDTDFGGITSADISPDGKILVAASGDTAVRFYDTSTWKKVGEYRDFVLEPFAVAFSKDGKFAVVGGADGQLTLLNPETGTKTRALSAQPASIEEIDSIDANHVAVLYFDSDGRKPPHLEVWDIQEGTSKLVALDQKVTAGAIVDGHIWFGSADASSLELRVGY